MGDRRRDRDRSSRDRDRERDRDRFRGRDRDGDRDRRGGHGDDRQRLRRERRRDGGGRDRVDRPGERRDRRGGRGREVVWHRDERRKDRSRSCSRRRRRGASPAASYGGYRRAQSSSRYSSSSCEEELDDDDDSNSNSSRDDRKKKKKAGNSGDSNKDEIVHFEWQKGVVMNSRYEVLKLLGDGTFGRVVLAKDRQQHGREMAIKIIRDVKRYIENARIEADILKDIRREDSDGAKSRSGILHDTFTHERHFCLVFEALGASLYDFVKRNEFRGFWLQDIQSFAEQSMEALRFLHMRLKMTHTDLKPENILLECLDDPRITHFPREDLWLDKTRSTKKSSPVRTPYWRPVNSRIRLIDFGNATYAHEHHSSIINTRQYRGPEVVLSLGWAERSDIWSMGCILMELYTGELLFGTHENVEHLALMERSVGPLPCKMLSRVSKAVKNKYLSFDQQQDAWRLNWPKLSSSTSSEKHVREQPTLIEMVAAEHTAFAQFVGKLLTCDPNERPTADEALKHHFFRNSYSD